MSSKWHHVQKNHNSQKLNLYSHVSGFQVYHEHRDGLICQVKFCISKYSILLGTLFKYSSLPNNRGASNKSMVAYNFLGLLHKNARFWSFLAYFQFKINSRGATIIRE